MLFIQKSTFGKTSQRVAKLMQELKLIYLALSFFPLNVENYPVMLIGVPLEACVVGST